MEKVAKPWPLRQPSGAHHIRPEDRAQFKLYKYGYTAKAGLRTVIPGEVRYPMVVLSSNDDGPIEAIGYRRACSKVATMLINTLKEKGIRQPKRFVLQYTVWPY